MQEYKLHEKAYFVTLTYDTAAVPITNKGYLTLNKRDVQLFFKRLRKRISETHNSVVKYYACGEYGGKTFRPHYHLILYGATVEDIEHAWSLKGKLIGLVTCDPVSQASVAYTCKYINKGKIIPMHQNDDRLPEFQLQSKSMGMNYLTPEMIDYHSADYVNRNHVTLEGGYKTRMPDVYRKKVFTDAEREEYSEHVQRLIIQKETEKQQKFAMEHPLDNYYRVQNERKKAVVQTFRERLKQRNKI